MYEMDGKMDNLVVLRASCVSLFSECTAGAGEWGLRATVERSSVEILGCRWH